MDEIRYAVVWFLFFIQFSASTQNQFVLTFRFAFHYLFRSVWGWFVCLHLLQSLTIHSFHICKFNDRKNEFFGSPEPDALASIVRWISLVFFLTFFVFYFWSFRSVWYLVALCKHLFKHFKHNPRLEGENQWKVK